MPKCVSVFYSNPDKRIKGNKERGVVVEQPNCKNAFQRKPRICERRKFGFELNAKTSSIKLKSSMKFTAQLEYDKNNCVELNMTLRQFVN